MRPADGRSLESDDFLLGFRQPFVDALAEAQVLAAPVAHPADAVAVVERPARTT